MRCLQESLARHAAKIGVIGERTIKKSRASSTRAREMARTGGQMAVRSDSFSSNGHDGSEAWLSSAASGTVVSSPERANADEVYGSKAASLFLDCAVEGRDTPRREFVVDGRDIPSCDRAELSRTSASLRTVERPTGQVCIIKDRGPDRSGVRDNHRAQTLGELLRAFTACCNLVSLRSLLRRATVVGHICGARYPLFKLALHLHVAPHGQRSDTYRVTRQNETP